MQKKILVLFIVLFGFTNLTAFGKSYNHGRHLKKQQNTIPDSILYAQVFNLVVGFDKNENPFHDYFKAKSNLSDEQQQILITVARNFISVFSLTPNNQKAKLSLQYRDDLKQLFGASAFERFDTFVRKDIASGISVMRSDTVLTIGGSNISLDEPQHKLVGFSSTFAFSFASPQVQNCSVSATMSGPNVSVSGSDSDPTCADHNPSVTLMSTTYLPNSQYCITGSHIRDSQTGSSSACLTTPAVSKVVNISFEQIATDDLPINTNPNIGGGLRIFPDKKNPTDSLDDRRKIRVRAQIGTNTAGVRIYFRNFDPDDPSSNAAPIDDEQTLNAGDDNNGNVDGTSNTRDGQFSIPQPNIKDCQMTTYGISCFTNSYGEAAVDFTVTMQPGDNFTIAASTDESYLSSLALATDGVNLKDTGNNQISATTSADISACYNSTFNACRTDMLTIWRRLHIEVDSMGNVTGNKVEGDFPEIGKVGRGQITLPVNVSSPLEPNRFENGRIVIGSRSFRIISRDLTATPPVDANTEDKVTINNTGTIFGISAGDTFTLYDDDDMDDEDTSSLNGDQGDNVPEPDTSLLQSNDTLCSSSVTSNCNVFASSYVRPVYDIALNTNNNRFFYLNVENDQQKIINTFGDFDQSPTSESQSYWTVYLYGGYQGDVSLDFDPNDQNNDGTQHGCGDGFYGVADDNGPNGTGAIIFMETLRPKEFPNDYLNHPISRAWTSAHEVGHLLGGDHNDLGLMERSCERDSYKFTPATIARLRKDIKKT